MRRYSLAVAVLLIVTAATSWGQLIDPQFYIGSGLGTPCVSGCGGDPNQISSTGFNIGLPGNHLTNNPVLVFLGIPNGTAATVAPTISSVTDGTNSYTFQLGGAAPSGFLVAGARGWNTTTGKVGSAAFAGFTSADTNVYDFIGLTGPTDSSINVSNLFGASSPYATLNGFNPSDFALFEYQINVGLSSALPIGISMSSAMPNGTIVFGYGQDSQHIYSTPWTVTGDVTDNGGGGGGGGQIPEPASIVLLGTVSLIIAGICRKKARFS